jgi:hypothetical protein
MKYFYFASCFVLVPDLRFFLVFVALVSVRVVGRGRRPDFLSWSISILADSRLALHSRARARPRFDFCWSRARVGLSCFLRQARRRVPIFFSLALRVCAPPVGFLMFFRARSGRFWFFLLLLVAISVFVFLRQVLLEILVPTRFSLCLWAAEFLFSFTLMLIE